MLAHVLLGARLEHPGEPEPERAEAPAYDRPAPPLTPVEVGEPAVEVARDARAVVVRGQAVSAPQPDGARPRGAHARGDEIERLVPARTPPCVGVPALAHERVEETLRVADDLAGGLSAHAEEAPAVGVLGIAGDADQPAVLDVHQHPAQRGMAVHRAHRSLAPPVRHGVRIALGYGVWIVGLQYGHESVITNDSAISRLRSGGT